MLGGWGNILGYGLGAMGLALVASGCGSLAPGDFDSESVINASCGVEQDQRGTFMAKVEGFPLLVRADSSFAGLERMAIEQAVSEWNNFGRTLVGQNLFVLEYAQPSETFHRADPRDCSTEGWGNAGTFSIVRETSTRRWRELTFTDAIPAATMRCYASGRVEHQVVMAYMKVVDPAQFGSIIIHELGHALGLDHSCTSEGGSEKFRACAGLPETHLYRQAVMYPTLRSRRSPFENPEIKSGLGANDTLRTSCLYGTAR
jgi:hypothetical protein